MEFRIAFRPLRSDDAIFINKLRNDQSMEKLLGGSIRPVSLERDLKWVEDILLKDDQRSVYFAVTEVGNDDIIGYTSISEIDYRNGTCFWSGIKLDTMKSGGGIGSEVALKIIKYAFEELRMARMKAECLEEHEGAKKMMERVGYVAEGLMRNSTFKNGKHNNQYLMSIIRSDFEVVREKFNL